MGRDMGQRINYVDTQYATNKQDAEMHNLIYGLGKYSKYNANQFANDDNPVTSFQLENNFKPDGSWENINNNVDPYWQNYWVDRRLWMDLITKDDGPVTGTLQPVGLWKRL